jgi:hypothetical protein
MKDAAIVIAMFCQLDEVSAGFRALFGMEINHQGTMGRHELHRHESVLVSEISDFRVILNKLLYHLCSI